MKSRALKGMAAAVLGAAVLLAGPMRTQAQTGGSKPDPHAAHAASQPRHTVHAPPDADLNAEIARLNGKILELQRALESRTKAHSPGGAMPMGMPSGPGMGGMTPGAQGMSGMTGTGGLTAGQGAPGGMSGPASGGMGMMDMMGGMGGSAAGQGMGGMSGGGMMNDMGMMGKMGASGMTGMPSALPGFPGASHLYHIGATGFFLDHPAHMALSMDQQAALAKAREQATLAKQEADRQIDRAEQDLWTLTAADQPDQAKIESKIDEITKIEGKRRMDFIRAVGEAANLLTDEQRKILTGYAPAAPAGGMTAPASPTGGMPAGGMGDM